MIVAAVVLLLGLLAGVAATQIWGLRLSGVLVVPLFALYTLFDFTSLPIILASVALAYVGVGLVHEHTLLYGRRLLYIAIGLGASIPLAVTAALSLRFGVTTPVEALSIGSVLPGIAAYNLHRLDGERRVDDVIASAAAFVGLVVLGASLVTPTVARLVAGVTPPVLFGQGSDIAALRGVATLGGGDPTVLGPAVGSLVVLAGIVLSGLYEDIWNVRLLGLITVPLLALLLFRDPALVGLYVVAVPVVYAVTTLVNRRTLIYGRVLLSISIGAGVVLSLALSTFYPVVSGHSLLVTAMLVGVGGYNLHRISPGRRLHTVGVSTGSFVAFVGVVHLLTRAYAPFDSQVAVLVGAVLCVPAVLLVFDLERKRRRDNRLSETPYTHT
ncbi:poly-gamma-glutamate biosynthesis protein PgsC/CapC [Halobium salinum]|uniref:Poly-gamma-glutamate biosynthesis protein PgsC/CapC n=1 Tax=Halobium salinum TaxID=1364940 RepID=A0ABD5PGJ9_9EURY|nr:poly-gamma-glutamate biosynthesis protein PgsC/CapC [Halobium salinum]